MEKGGCVGLPGGQSGREELGVGMGDVCLDICKTVKNK